MQVHRPRVLPSLPTADLSPPCVSFPYTAQPPASTCVPDLNPSTGTRSQRGRSTGWHWGRKTRSACRAGSRRHTVANITVSYLEIPLTR